MAATHLLRLTQRIPCRCSQSRSSQSTNFVVSTSDQNARFCRDTAGFTPSRRRGLTVLALDSFTWSYPQSEDILCQCSNRCDPISEDLQVPCLHRCALFLADAFTVHRERRAGSHRESASLSGQAVGECHSETPSKTAGNHRVDPESDIAQDSDWPFVGC